MLFSNTSPTYANLELVSEEEPEAAAAGGGEDDGGSNTGMLLALGILAMTVGLIRGESSGDLWTLTATGASSRVRRTLTATTAGALGLLGALLGVAGAYLVLVATYNDDLGYLSSVPVLYLVGAVIGVPLAAAAAGWLIAGREPPAIARSVIE